MDRILNKNAVLKNIDTVPYIGFPVFSAYPQIACGFSTRLGGVSRGIFASMNLGFARGDEDKNVMENYRRICSSIGIFYQDIVLPDQVHETTVRLAKAEDRGKGIVLKRDYSRIDAQITNVPGVPLAVFGADCVPIFLFDPVQNAIGTVHAGWKGTAGKIAATAVKKMQECFGCCQKDILAVIGPSIGPECYEVGEDVATAVYNAFLQDGLLMPNGKQGKYQLDLWEANRRALLGAGMPEQNITVSGLCTMCRQDLFFSHRATEGKRGSMAGFFMLV